MTPTPPVVLIIAGNDPSGGAGQCADVQAVSARGAHPAPVLAALTVQDTCDATRVDALDPALVIAQAEAVLADLPVMAIKLGLLASAANGRAVAALLARHPRIPVVVDPVLYAAGGAALAETELVAVYLELLLPRATVVTPNALEARRLAPTGTDAASRAAVLLGHGAGAVLIKGGDETTPAVDNSLFLADGSRHDWRWPRLAGQFHGSGCTLAAALAAELAHGHPLPLAAAAAQAWTQTTLATAWALGRGQLIPARHA
jgi:hydroxymethylpyrimidine/phosphomethylpyrimidine kinase